MGGANVIYIHMVATETSYRAEQHLLGFCVSLRDADKNLSVFTLPTNYISAWTLELFVKMSVVSEPAFLLN